MVDAAVSRFGRLDVLVNSASLWRATPWPDTSEADWDLLHGDRGEGLLPVCAGRGPAPVRARRRRHHQHHGSLGPGAVPGVRGALGREGCRANLTYSLAIEMAPDVRVNAIAPGAVLPPPDYTPEHIQAAASKNLLGRWGSAENMASAVVFLAEADFITGVLLPVDGGEMLAWRRR